MRWLERGATLLPVLLSTVLLVGTIVACGADAPVSPTVAHGRELPPAESDFGATLNPAEAPAVSSDELEGGDETLNPAPAPADLNRAVLVELYHSTGGPVWKNSHNWVSDRPLDEWFGVIADDQGRVMRLRLASNNLQGTLPGALGNLSNLETLRLDGNSLSGLIPPEIGKLSSLETLSLGSNNLEGPIPSELGNLTSLETLRLDGNSKRPDPTGNR